MKMFSRTTPKFSKLLNLRLNRIGRKNLSNFVKCWREKFGNFLKSDGWFFFLLLILNVTIFFQAFVYGSEIRPFQEILINGIKNFYLGAVAILIICAMIYFWLEKFPRAKFFLQVLILIIFAIFFIIDFFLLYKFELTLQEYMIVILIGTNPATVKEFFQNYVLNLPVMLGTAATIFLIVTAVKKFRAGFQNLSENNLRKISNCLLIILLPAVLHSAYWIGNIVLVLAQNSFQNTILGRNILNTRAAIENVGNDAEIFAEMDSQDEKIISNNSKIPYVVFVLGEATTRNHMQLYGYNLQNNPLLTARYKRGEIFKFNDVIACANYTTTAMELIFTFSEKDSAEKWYTAPNIFDILRRAGYHTVWISNQSATGLWGNTDKIYSERCDEKFFDENAEGGKIFSREIDGVLLPPLDNFISKSHEKNFYLIHLYGSHRMYDARYPKDFEKFTAADEDKPDEKAKKFTAEYDNSILYNDFIMNEIFKRFEDKNALIIYISDHGEEVFENGKDFSGHSWEGLGNRSMIEIPMLIWTSKTFNELYPEKISALKNSVDKPYRTDLIIHTVLDLMDIRTESFNAAKSIVNENFDTSFKRIYNRQIYTKN